MFFTVGSLPTASSSRGVSGMVSVIWPPCRELRVALIIVFGRYRRCTKAAVTGVSWL